MRIAAVVSPHPPLNGVTRREDGHNYEMVYAPEVSSTSPEGEVRVRGLGNGDWDWTGEPGPVGWAQGAAGQAGLGKQESLVGKVQAVKGLPGHPSREWEWVGATEDGAPRDTGNPSSSGGPTALGLPSWSSPRSHLEPEDIAQPAIESALDGTAASASSREA